ncbi:receptor-like protein EIX2 [Lactuca sativa]|uniref:receptor-like protein EIX2 n=1 Tax=Lactuca sativa TaxID=4236 RepID=UPI0022AE909B|nr:receptor-like protein EIX2 [Lactuca sativa]
MYFESTLSNVGLYLRRPVLRIVNYMLLFPVSQGYFEKRDRQAGKKNARQQQIAVGIDGASSTAVGGCRWQWLRRRPAEVIGGRDDQKRPHNSPISVLKPNCEATYTCLGVGNVSVLCSEQERLALLKFKQSVEDPFGMLSSWVGNECCMWEGIQCDGVTGNVQRLHLKGDDYCLLVGNKVSSSLAELRHLKYLDLSQNYFQGSRIPEFIGSLKHLSYLNLSDAGFEATYSCLGVGNVSFICSEQERVALLKFKQSVEDPFGMLSSWVGNECCMWERIQCDGVTGNVQRLHLKADDYYYISGNKVSSSLAELRHLKYLDLSGNNFYGIIPEFIGSLKQLTYLNLSDADFQGIIPPRIGNLSNLKVLDLSSNDYELKADDMAWAFGLSSLELLNLSYVDLSGAQNWDMMLHMIPSLKELSLSDCRLSNVNLVPFLNSSRILPNIKHLDLGYNSFKGPLPDLLQNMTSLTFLSLSGFNLSLAWNFPKLLSMIPSLSELHLSGCGLDKTHLFSPHLNYSTLSNIQHLDLSHNPLGSIFPSILTNMSSLEVLDLSYTMLNSSVPIMPKLLELHLSGNEFKQIEDVGIWRQCHLKRLSVIDNEFDMEMTDSPKNASECSQYSLELLELSGSLKGRIPETLGGLANLRDLDLSYNKLTGSIPESVTGLRFLQVLDLSENQLTGPIPEFLGNLTQLVLSSNQLNGSIPESLGKLASLTDLDLGSNLLDGTIPVSIGQIAKLRTLYISNNSLEGAVTEAHFANLSVLKYLDASSNTKLTFNVSCGWIPPFQLIYLSLSSCNIGNGFPQWLRHQRKLKRLELSNATLSGPLPTWLRKMPIISYLDLSHNKLSGSLKNLPNAKNDDVYGFFVLLLLEYNLFSGSIPRSLCRRTYLEGLDLSRNMLSGKIPNCVGNLQGLAIMSISSNQLSGAIPSSIALISSLFWLNLNKNNFTGEVPPELGNLQSLRVLDLGDNKLYGNIPNWIGKKLTSLVVLSLHKNNFTGRIPPSLCKSSNLQILDLAYNNLTGTIPPCVGNLNGMVVSHSISEHFLDIDDDKNVIQVMKGVDLEYTTTWRMVYNMDLSSNKLEGEIPVELTTLSMLVGLNLSNNHLRGGIPDSIGKMKKLETLDFSKNKLSGSIPPSMAALTFLSHLNLSHNNLTGQIPTGNQLQTLTDPSIYAGNKHLCGPPLPNTCSNHQDSTTTSKKKYKAADEKMEVWLFYVDIMSGFGTGFWGVIGVLMFKKQWRWNLFMFAEETMDKIYVAVVVRVAKFKRGRE